jgi:hypothetical protein
MPVLQGSVAIAATNARERNAMTNARERNAIMNGG